METYLDIRTLSFTNGVIYLIVFLFLLFVQHTRKTYPGFQMWTIASFLGFFAFILLSLQGLLLDFFTIIVANTILIGSVLVMAHGLEVFAEKSPKLGAYIALIILMIVSLIYFTYFSPNLAGRIITISSIYTIIFCLCFLL